MVRKIYSQYTNQPPKVKQKVTQLSMAQQQFAYESDLNNLVDRNMRFKDPAFVTKLQLSGGNANVKPIFGDFTTVEDYQTSLNVINESKQRFMSLPSEVRKHFDNNPAKLLAFVNDKSDEAYKKGIELGIYKHTSERAQKLVSDKTIKDTSSVQNVEQTAS